MEQGIWKRVGNWLGRNWHWLAAGVAGFIVGLIF